ncbi:MAG: exonuclease domain-containing protein [Actinomycetota bacterium]
MTTSWVEGPLPALDLETTGIDPRLDRIVEVALVFISPDGQETATGYSTIVAPGVPIPPEASAVHGITDERAASEGVAPEDALRETVARLDWVSKLAAPLVIFNAAFDWPLLQAEAARHGIALPRLPLLDPLIVDRKHDRYRKGSRTLDAVAAHYGVPASDLHRASGDARIAAGIARALVDAYPELRGLTPRELHDLQVGWHAEWRDGFNDWLRRKGRLDLVTGDWPGA